MHLWKFGEGEGKAVERIPAACLKLTEQDGSWGKCCGRDKVVSE
jgi:hypothetical protein